MKSVKKNYEEKALCLLESLIIICKPLEKLLKL